MSVMVLPDTLRVIAPFSKAAPNTAGSNGFRTDEVEPAHALGLLVGLTFKDSPHVAGIRGDPSQVKGRAFVVSREILGRIRNETPIRLLLEDLEWADGASWDYLIQVMLEAPAEKGLQGVFVLAAARPEWNPPEQLATSTNYRRMDLQPLSDQATRELVSELLQPALGSVTIAARFVMLTLRSVFPL